MVQQKALSFNLNWTASATGVSVTPVDYSTC